MVVDEYFRRAMGRPWLSVAIDLATRGSVAIVRISAIVDARFSLIVDAVSA